MTGMTTHTCSTSSELDGLANRCSIAMCFVLLDCRTITVMSLVSRKVL
jgi:hypothetical protein